MLYSGKPRGWPTASTQWWLPRARWPWPKPGTIPGRRCRSAPGRGAARAGGARQLTLPALPAARCSAPAVQRADLHLVTLRDEVAGLLVPSKYAAALAAGRPVLVVGGSGSDLFAEVEREGLGWACEHDAAQVERALKEAISQPSLVERSGARARDVFEQRYSRQRSIASWLRPARAGVGCGRRWTGRRRLECDAALVTLDEEH